MRRRLGASPQFTKNPFNPLDSLDKSLFLAFSGEFFEGVLLRCHSFLETFDATLSRSLQHSALL